jgi:hypothetical protein
MPKAYSVGVSLIGKLRMMKEKEGVQRKLNSADLWPPGGYT